MCKDCCQKPENLKDKPESGSPDMIETCHGKDGGHAKEVFGPRGNLWLQAGRLILRRLGACSFETHLLDRRFSCVRV
jgi:hypothetical protein